MASSSSEVLKNDVTKKAGETLPVSDDVIELGDVTTPSTLDITVVPEDHQGHLDPSVEITDGLNYSTQNSFLPPLSSTSTPNEGTFKYSQSPEQRPGLILGDKLKAALANPTTSAGTGGQQAKGGEIFMVHFGPSGAPQTGPSVHSPSVDKYRRGLFPPHQSDSEDDEQGY